MLLNIKAMETCKKSRINIKSGKHSLEHVLKIVVFLFARGVEQAEVDGCLSLCQGCGAGRGDGRLYLCLPLLRHS